MIDFETARNDAYQQLLSTYTVSLMEAEERREIGLLRYKNVWKVGTEIFLPDDMVVPLTFHVALPDDFPLVLPKIYLSKANYAWIKYIPHVNSDPNVCLFDDEFIKVDAERPGVIVDECIRRAKKIIEEGLHKKNTQDFNDEFIAYWEDKYDEKDQVISALSVLRSTDEILGDAIRLLYLKEPYLGYSHILLSPDEETATSFRLFFTNNNVSFEELDALYLGSMESVRPPFFLTNESAFEFVTRTAPAFVKRYESFINKATGPKIVVFSVMLGGRKLYFGWSVGALNTARDGFRPGMLPLFRVYRTFQKHDAVIRLRFEEFTQERLLYRTDGPSQRRKSNQFVIAGVGSIGSNLLPYLYSSELRKLTLIDPDFLTIENINRHLLGLPYINQEKVAGLKHYFENKNPLLKIATYPFSAIQVLRSNPDAFNDADCVFVVIGKDSLERYLFEAVAENQIKRPTFILWVEPFLCGGHCLYVTPGHLQKFDDLYEDGFYKYNVIDPKEYSDPSRQLLFREAGCQSSYVPYGQKNITLFLSAIIPYIFDALDGDERTCFRLTWKGNKEIAADLNLSLSPAIQSLAFGAVQKTAL